MMCTFLFTSMSTLSAQTIRAPLRIPSRVPFRLNDSRRLFCLRMAFIKCLIYAFRLDFITSSVAISRCQTSLRPVSPLGIPSDPGFKHETKCVRTWIRIQYLSNLADAHAIHNVITGTNLGTCLD